MSEARPRLPIVPVPSEDPHLSSLFAEAAAQQGRVSNLYRTLASSPAMLGAWIGMAWPLRHEPKLDRKLRELAIMRVAQSARAEYEWAHHWRLATEFGVSEEQLRALKDWRGSTLFDKRARAVLAYADGIVDLDVPDALFDPLRQWFDAAQLVELTLTISFYCHVARTLVALRIELEPGFDPHSEAM